ncbi:MAG: hypothetical protein LBV41_04315, partial [Cytophagaceae bacterium]|nr:hypothetical protein [Cytophagaceae bacterium]
AEGLVEGEAIGLEKGEAIGLEKGLAEGLAERNRLKAEKEAVQSEKEAAQAKLADVVINAHRAGIPAEAISKITGLPVEEIIKIIKATGESTLG